MTKRIDATERHEAAMTTLNDLMEDCTGEMLTEEQYQKASVMVSDYFFLGLDGAGYKGKENEELVGLLDEAQDHLNEMHRIQGEIQECEDDTDEDTEELEEELEDAEGELDEVVSQILDILID